MLTKDQIKSAQDRPREFVPLPEWTPAGEAFDPAVHGVYVGTMSGRDRDAWELCLQRKKTDSEEQNLSNVRALLAVYAVQDESGQRIFTEADAEILADKSAGPLSAIFDAALRLNKLRKQDQEELVKN